MALNTLQYCRHQDKVICLPKCSPFSWQGHPFNQIFTCFQKSIKTRHESVVEPPAPLDMTIVWSARVQNATTSAPKLDLPLRPLTMGCWDAITIKATTASPCTPHTTPDLRLPLQKILTSFFFYHFPQIVPLCPALLELRGERGSLNLNVFDETGREWVRVHMSMCVCLLCVMSSMRFPSSHRGPCETWLTPAKSRRL